MSRIRILAIGVIVLLGCIAVVFFSSDQSWTRRKVKLDDPPVEAVLRKASELTLKQHHGSWDDVLLEIVEMQIRAGDFDGAIESIGGCKDGDHRSRWLVHIAEALARDGKRERAFDIANMAYPDRRAEDRIQLCWIEHLIASHDLDAAGKALEQLKSAKKRPEGLRNLAAAYSMSGDANRAAELFKLAVDAAIPLKNEFDRLFALQKIADAQLTSGKPDDAKATIRLLVDAIEFKVPWARFLALRDSAVLAAKANDRQTAVRLFQRAIDTHREVGETNGNWKLETVGLAQANVGYFDDARKTASMIKPSADPQYNFASRNIRCAIAEAQLKSGDVEGAIESALSVEYDVELRDKTLHAIVDSLITKNDLKTALSIAEKIEHQSCKATAVLKVAAAHAKSNDRKTAAAVAKRIDLKNDRVDSGRPKRFDYRTPRSWGSIYGFTGFYTHGSYSRSVQDAAEVAAAAMALAQALGEGPAQSYAVLFDDDNRKVVQSLARAQAASDDAGQALAWAEEIGSDAVINANDDNKVQLAVDRRINALIGVAAGILDRSSDPVKRIAVRDSIFFDLDD